MGLSGRRMRFVIRGALRFRAFFIFNTSYNKNRLRPKVFIRLKEVEREIELELVVRVRVITILTKGRTE